MGIKNPLVFIGQKIFGLANPGAPLSSDANGLLASGIYNTEVSATANATTTSSSDAVLTGMTITPPAGTYLVVFSTWVTHSTANSVATFSLYVDTTQKADSIRSVIPLGGVVIGLSAIDIPVAINGLVSVNGSQAIAVKWNTTGGGTATAHQRTMNIVKLSNP